MTEKKYYLERHGHPGEPMTLEILRRLFHSFYVMAEKECYFQEYFGYECVDSGHILGKLGPDINAAMYQKLKKLNLWPIEKTILDYDEPTLFSTIEFLYDHVSKATDKFYHDWNNCGWHGSAFDKEEGKKYFRGEVNKLLVFYGPKYELSEEGLILQKPEHMEQLVSEPVVTSDPKNIDARVKIALNKYLRYGATVDEKKDAIRTLGDVLEFFKKSNIKLPNKDESDLFNILNNFDIRHNNREQQSDYDTEIWYDWFFYTFLASIHVLAKMKKN